MEKVPKCNENPHNNANNSQLNPKRSKAIRIQNLVIIIFEQSYIGEKRAKAVIAAVTSKIMS